jgi:hypothetical protein
VVVVVVVVVAAAAARGSRVGGLASMVGQVLL